MDGEKPSRGKPNSSHTSGSPSSCASVACSAKYLAVWPMAASMVPSRSEALAQRLEGVQFAGKTREITPLTVAGQDGAVPEIGADVVIRFAVTYELPPPRLNIRGFGSTGKNCQKTDDCG